MEPHEALVREALDACTGPALALDARGRVLAANAALLVRLGISGEAVNGPIDRLRVSGPALTRRRRAPAALDVHATGRAPARFQATVRRDASCGRLLVALRDDDTPAPAATLLERQLDLREHVGDDPSDFFREATETLAETLAVERAAIWLFDDDPATRSFTACRLAPTGVRALADAALAALQDEPSRFRGLITDLHMPKQDGCDLLAAARRLAPGLPVAVATGFLDDAAQRQLADMGVRHVLDKPFDQAALARFLAGFGRGETGTTSA